MINIVTCELLYKDSEPEAGFMQLTAVTHETERVLNYLFLYGLITILLYYSYQAHRQLNAEQ